MSRVTIIRPDNKVVVDGAVHNVDCGHLPSFFRALQWYGDAIPPYGEIEYSPDAQGRPFPNTRFSDLAPYQSLVDDWTAAESADAAVRRLADEAKAQAEAALAALAPPSEPVDPAVPTEGAE